MNRIPAPIAALTAICALVVTATAGGQSTAVVYAPKDCTTPKIEPKRISLACADDGARLKRLRWESWNTSSVSGEGRLVVAKCEPDCTAGGVRRYDVRVKLRDIELGGCGGVTVPLYTRATLRFEDEKPDGARALRRSKLECRDG